MRPQQTSQTGAGSSPWLVFDYQSSGMVALQVDVSGTVNWTLEQTLANPLITNPIPAGSILPSYDTNMVSQTVARQANYIAAPRAARVTVNSGAGSATLIAIQYAGNT